MKMPNAFCLSGAEKIAEKMKLFQLTGVKFSAKVQLLVSKMAGR